MQRSSTKRCVATQLCLPFKIHGGFRPGAGRKPVGDRSGVPHVARARVTRHTPVHVTWRLCAGLPGLRQRQERELLRGTLGESCEAPRSRLVHWSVQDTHLHLLLEADDERGLSRDLQVLGIRIAKRLNRFWKRRGRVFADRYHARALRTPREARNALLYVLNNHRRHGLVTRGTDPCSSAAWFDGWVEEVPGAEGPRPVALPRSWLLTDGWRRHGRISVDEVPRGR